MEQRAAQVTFKGSPLTLVGTPPQPGDEAPDCELIGNDLSPVKLSDFADRARVITSVPSLDTGVCDTETRRFNVAAGEMGPGVVVLAVSMDLPFAQSRWCGAAGVDSVVTLSDHRDAAFGKAYGVLIRELRLLARAVWVVDRQGIVRHLQLVKELTEEPDYDSVMKAVEGLGG